MFFRVFYCQLPYPSLPGWLMRSVSYNLQQAATSQLHAWLSELEEQERSYEEDED